MFEREYLKGEENGKGKEYNELLNIIKNNSNKICIEYINGQEIRQTYT